MASSTVGVGREYITCDGPNCNEVNPPKRCSKCKCTYYCSVQCQKAHWKHEHKADCRDIDWMREQQVANLRGDGGGNGEEEGGAADVSAVSSGADAEANTCCYICLEDTIKDPFAIPGCGHVCCFSCLQRWQGFVKNGRRTATRAGSTDATASSVTCPACRAVAPDIEQTILEKARLHAARANRHGLGEGERQQYRELAMAELEKVTGSNDASLQFHALFSKAGILLLLNRPHDASAVLEELIGLHESGTQTADRIERMLDRAKELEDSGQEEEAERIVEEAGMLAGKCKRLDNHGFDAYERLARAKEMMEDWEGAKGVYIERMLKKMTDPTVGTPPQQRMMWMGLSRCMYHLGEYDKAINAGTAAIEMNRHFPQVHKYVALSQRASGDLEAARRTMARAVNYETPWDDENKLKVLE
eukprot:CAMPEP_0178543676 /NCGR_PEP_ID=MMETSP0697-20121206/2713_1 /TAXON_ID=265572 /ORGANISM="Extubocellulus spinifer, Strain CCMP396" /LENGTH=416 /DNA_ID=CAMNT_0020176147 /DNA_START=73 /DNA_END=1320 /DNA_ORIENTATION=-